MSYISQITLPDSSTYDIRDANVTNPNLLINPDFAINQRGQSQYTTAGYTFDGWAVNAGTVSKNADGGVILNNTASSAMRYRQYSEIEFAQLAGKKLTLSVCVDGVIYCGTGDVPQSEPSEITAIITIPVSGTVSVSLNYNVAKKAFDFYVYLVAGTSVALSWGKLERGGVATPFVPPIYAEELARCQRYYQLRSTGDVAAVDMRPVMATIKDIKQREDGYYEYIAEL